MTKYAALGDYLSTQKAGRVQMSFAEIERIIGGKLPASQRYPAWWSNNPMNNTMTKVWLDAGYQTEQVDIAARKLVFRRVTHVSSNDNKDVSFVDNIAVKQAVSAAHPLFGCMSGTVHIPDGVDLTEPADPEWGEIAYGSDIAKKRG